MPRPSKRARTSRLAAQASLREELQDSEVSSPVSDTPVDCHSDSEWSEVEEDLRFPIAQPTEGWKIAERGLPSVQGAAGEKSRSTQSYYKRKRELEAEESAKNRSLYGDISQFF